MTLEDSLSRRLSHACADAAALMALESTPCDFPVLRNIVQVLHSLQIGFDGASNLLERARPSVSNDEFNAGSVFLRLAETLASPPRLLYNLPYWRALHAFIFQDLSNCIDSSISLHERPQSEAETQTQLTLLLLAVDENIQRVFPGAFAKAISLFYFRLNWQPIFEVGNSHVVAAFINAVARQAGYRLSWSLLAKHEAFLAARHAVQAADNYLAVETTSVALGRLFDVALVPMKLPDVPSVNGQGPAE